MRAVACTWSGCIQMHAYTRHASNICTELVVGGVEDNMYEPAKAADERKTIICMHKAGQRAAHTRHPFDVARGPSHLMAIPHFLHPERRLSLHILNAFCPKARTISHI